LAYFNDVKIIETPIFTKSIIDLVPDDSYRELQAELLLRPEAGDLIPGTGGLRKIRWRIPGHGKSGGLRIIYYIDYPDAIYMLMAYKKSRQENLSPQQTKLLKHIVREWLV
jgi:hypothetical protein